MGDALSWTRDRVMDNKWRGKKASVTCRQKKKKRTSGWFNRCSHIWRSVCADRSLRGKRPPQQQPPRRGRDDRPGCRPAGAEASALGCSREAAFFLPAFANVRFRTGLPGLPAPHQQGATGFMPFPTRRPRGRGRRSPFPWWLKSNLKSRV